MEIAFLSIMSVTIMMTAETILMKLVAVSSNINRIKDYNAVEIKISEPDNSTKK